MRHSQRRSRHGRGGSGGSFWLSFSDMMSALLLVFVLIMFYSVYQYLDMLEVKTAELMRQSGLLDQKQAELTEKDAALTQQAQELTQKDAALATSQEKLNESEKELLSQQAKLLLFQQELDSSEELLTKQRDELDAARALLSDQETLLAQQKEQMDRQQATMDQQQIMLDQKQTTVDEQQTKMEEQQSTMDEQQALLTRQQAQMDAQQSRLDALVGVRARIIASLAQALQDNNIRATVDPQNGSITLDANIFFDVGKSVLKDSGKSVLDQFIPIYLATLLDSDNAANIAEIIIEGHTDTDGTYMSNLKLSQERALSVMEYILADEYRGITGAMKRKLRQIATANGRSFSNPVYDELGNVDKDASRRVEFKFRLQDEQMIEDMRDILEGM